MNEGWLTAQTGIIEQIGIVRYNFPESRISDPEKAARFLFWLSKQSDVNLVRHQDQIIETFLQLPVHLERQFNRLEEHVFSPPYQNCLTWSACLGEALKKHLVSQPGAKVCRGELIIAETKIESFALTKCATPQIYLLPDGRCYIFWECYLKTEHSGKPLSSARMQEILEEASAGLNQAMKGFAHAPVKETIMNLNNLFEHLAWPAWLKPGPEKFIKLPLSDCTFKSNLFTGRNPQGQIARSSLQTAAYYNGISRPVHNAAILPVCNRTVDLSLFRELVARFNHGGRQFVVLEPAMAWGDLNTFRDTINDAKSKFPGALLLAVLCEGKLGNEVFAAIKKHPFRILTGKMGHDKATSIRLSNFVCSCLQGLGGIVAAIAETGLSAGDFFIGIHRNPFRNAEYQLRGGGIALFDHRGIFQLGYAIRGMQPEELLSAGDCTKWVKQLRNKLKYKFGLANPGRMIIHLPFRIDEDDVRHIKDAFQQLISPASLDILEIQHQNNPLLVQKDGTRPGEVIFPASGKRWTDIQKRLGLLMTNVQAVRTGGNALPLLLKHHDGPTPLDVLTEQVYWLTKVCTNNIFLDAKLPATLRLAKEAAGRGIKNHRPGWWEPGKTTYL
jgi:hypothetical protein